MSVSDSQSRDQGVQEIVLDLGRLSQAAARSLPCGMASANSRLRHGLESISDLASTWEG